TAISARDTHVSSNTHLRGRLLRHIEVDVDGIERLQLNDRIAARQVLADVHLADAENPGERRGDELALNGGPDLANACSGLLVLCRRAIEFGAGDDVVFEQPLHPVEIRAREIALGFGSRQLRALLARVELDEHVASPHRFARIECDAIYRAG